MANSASSINVCIRVRPFTVREAAQLSHVPDGPVFLGDGSLAGAPVPKLSQKGIRSVIKVVDDKCLVFDPPEDNPIHKFSRSVVPVGKRTKDQTFAFDRIFDDNASQGEVYEGTTRTLLDSVLDGYNATVFAYGATGCGKTHTITGTIQQPGIIFLTMQELFERLGEQAEEKVSEISLSYLEIYNETIRDLLVPGGSKQGLMLREDSHQAVSVAGLSSHSPQNVQDVMDMIVRGNEYRTMSPTEANATSSRSHAVLQINISQKDRNASVNEPHTMATLSIIDLAGSERASATKNRGERLLEGANINKSLLALGSCINALCDPRKKNHVPYRNSKLTRLLKFSLGGNCRTVMIVCVSPSSAHFDETQNTLRYANRAKNIQTKVTRNVYNVNRHVKDFLVKIDEQMALINELKAQQKDYEAVAFAKFQKQTEKRDAVVREGIARIRSAYEHSVSERNEKIGNMKKLRQAERRIAAISAWTAAFDQVTEMQEDESILQNLQAMRKTALGILTELETSRHHFHARVSKSNWERAIDSALQNSLRQLNEVDGRDEEGYDASNLSREAEILKSMAERESLVAVAEQEKSSDASVVQVLLKAHFDTIAAVQMLTKMDEQDAVRAAKGILGRVLQACTEATSHVVKPDGSLAPVEHFAPTKPGTPKRKKMSILTTSVPAVNISQATTLAAPPQLAITPLKSSPKRRRFPSVKKGVSFSPKKSPSKIARRGVRWRDENEEGMLADFEKTPQKAQSTPEVSSAEALMPPPPLPLQPPQSVSAHISARMSDTDSSPIPQPPESTAAMNTRSSNRFRSGFLMAKKGNGSTLSPLVRNMNLDGSSDSEPSPLRDLEPSNASNRSSLHYTSTVSQDDSELSTSETSGTNENAPPATQEPRSSSSSPSSSSETRSFKANKSETQKIRSAVKRQSLALPSSGTASAPIRTAHRRRSPTAATGSSPPGGDRTLFTASHARRMVKSERESSGLNFASVLSPRSQPVTKASTSAQPRRMTVSAVAGEGRALRETSARMSVAGVGSALTAAGGAGNRASLVGQRSVWR